MASTFVFVNSGDIIHINNLTFAGVEPTNAVCTPSTATPDVLNHYTTEASPKIECSGIRIVRRKYVDGLKVKTLVNHKKAI